jgi:uncharacterized repeat protein (TIGR01451 family)
VVGNSTQGTDWDDPISAQTGDVVAFQVFYHNGVENTIARNTRIRVDLPQEATSTLVSQAYLWADNAAVVTDSGTINVNQSQTIEYLPGTTKWYPNRSQTPTSLPDGITENGVNIGDIMGCWPYSGFVVFQAKLKDAPAPPAPNFVYSKSAYNVTRGVDATSIINRPNDLIEYRLTARNTGDGSGTVQVRDNIQNVLRYGRMVRLNGGTLSNNVISWPSVTVQPNSSITKSFQIRIKEAIPANQTVNLTNTYGNRVIVPARRDISFDPGLTITKTVRNVTTGESRFVNHNTGQPGDTLQYRIKITNTGDVQLDDLTVRDILPNKLTYLNGTARYGYGSDNINRPLSDRLVGQGVNLGRLVHQGQVEGHYQWLRIQFNVTVNSNIGPGSYLLTNRVNTVADYQTEINNGQLSDSAQADTRIEVAEQPALTINKEVRNINRPTDWLKQVGAVAGERVAYRITIKNTGETTITDLQAVDILPANIYLVPNSGQITYQGQTNRLTDDLIEKYIDLPQLNPSQQLMIVFQAQTDKSLANQSLLINTSQAKGAGLTERSVAKVTITEKPEPQEEITGPLAKTGSAYLDWFLGLFGVVGIGYWLYALRLMVR